MSVYEHYRKEEHTFVDQVLEWKEIVIEQYRSKLTDFLDPRQQEIVLTVIGNDDEVHISFWGGHEQAERKRCILYPTYFELSYSDFEINVYELNYPHKFVQIEHRHLLGALMNVGLKREKFGDILTDGQRFQIVLAHEVADFVKWNVTSVGKAKVSLNDIQVEDLIQKEDNLTFTHIISSSLRLDTIIGEIYHLSRAKAKELVEGGYVRVNWKIIEDPSFSLQEKDTISVRGKGRTILYSNEGFTKKDKYRLIIGTPK
ncbi:RNA-binding protein [Evansella sp. AB-P1]|uniref:YlmH family RNA-binding protein n=1 Tax=Evansella sp. AB-P1 TaxID=3037653 RepID=UPI00241DB3D8|nr:RNA-binding protein [Evansella sp. AB-P1]MDG5788270.1 RNA-binding protein [Evansella sp. AB-P1]